LAQISNIKDNKPTTVKAISNLQEMEILRPFWEKWQNHPNNDFSHFQIVCQLRKDVVTPQVLVAKRDGEIIAKTALI